MLVVPRSLCPGLGCDLSFRLEGCKTNSFISFCTPQLKRNIWYPYQSQALLTSYCSCWLCGASTLCSRPPSPVLLASWPVLIELRRQGIAGTRLHLAFTQEVHGISPRGASSCG